MQAYIMAFVIGGLICVIGQLLMDLTPLTPAHVLVLFVVLGGIMSGLGLYQPLVEMGGGRGRPYRCRDSATRLSAAPSKK